METKIFGILDNDNCLIDISKTERGCKRYATIHGYTEIGYRIGYNAFTLAKKVGKKWVTIN